MARPISFILFWCVNFLSTAQVQPILVTGLVKNESSELLQGAHITIEPTAVGIITNEKGIFELNLSPGKKKITVSFTGYKTIRENIDLQKDTTLYFFLETKAEQLQDLIITGNRNFQSDQLQNTRSSTLALSSWEINTIPVLGGEADPIKTLQLLPGVAKGVEGTTDLFVRGGAADQNLILLDGAPVYNTGHLFGFLSVFNADILQDVTAINGAFPADVGGRLSSIMKVNTRSSFTDKTKVMANVGLLASRLMVQQPIIKNKVDVWVAARRTYIDKVVTMFDESLPYYFYDVNAKLLIKPDDKNRIEMAHYSGEDVLNFVREARDTSSNFRFTSDFTIANTTQTLVWTRTLNENSESSLNIYRTRFNYAIQNQFEDSKLFTNSNITDWGAKWILTKRITPTLQYAAGWEAVHHEVSPNVITTSGEIAQLLESSSTRGQVSLENSLFFQADGSLGKYLKWSSGLRVSSAYVANTFYVNPEPRLAIRYEVSKTSALKASYSRMAQYLHRVSSAAVAFPTDIWYPVTDRVQPQTANQFTLAYTQQFPGSFIFLSLESYYKQMKSLIGYREGTNLFLNTNFEEQLIQGRGNSYGLEFLLKKESGKLTGWIAYTLSKSTRQFDEINSGKTFLARYDRRHNGSVVLNYALVKRISLTSVFEFISGSRFTPVIGQYIVPAPNLGGVQLVPVYAPVNSVKLADTHRLDLGLKLFSRPERRYKSEWFIGVYNVYNRATPIGINIEPNPDGSYRYEQPGLFGTVPFISFGISI
ncbi:MAG: carboxypeptidase-like regulatory domain-containing protein [Cyclobacteriaceae bacterium]|nr:carboxypeptidase-like regulatory domain-containing protein [Cyclobacteriaceae bacterium]